jgi:hypothetical protein
MTGGTFASSVLCHVEIDSANPIFHLNDGLLMDSRSRSLIGSFITRSTVRIGDDIETIGRFSFCDRQCISAIEFGPLPRVSSIEEAAFNQCQHLESICIPSSVISLGDFCFSLCYDLKTVSFAADSKLTSIGKHAFGGTAVQSIAIPSSVEVLGDHCFIQCLNLNAVTFASDSKLVRIGTEAFVWCSAWQAFHLPPLVKYVGSLCFHSCSSLSAFGFASPVHIQDLLDVPAAWDSAEVPDSVQTLGLGQTGLDRPFVLHFGMESRLASVIMTGVNARLWPRCFLQVSTRSLRLFRANLEFASAA